MINDTEKLKLQLEKQASNLEEIHKLASLLNKFCQSHINNDELYEVSSVARLIEKELSELGYNLYLILHSDEQYYTMQEALEMHSQKCY